MNIRKKKMNQDQAKIYILEDPRRTREYNKIKDTCINKLPGISIEIHDSNNNYILQGISSNHCDAAIDLYYSQQRLFILLELTSLIHYCEDEEKLVNSRTFFHNKGVIANDTKVIPIIHYERKPKPVAEKAIKVGNKRIILMSCNDNIIQILKEYVTRR